MKTEDAETRSMEGKICLVVGGAQGIGAVIADTLSHAGASVIATSSRTSLNPSDGKVQHLDVRDTASVTRALDRVAEEHGRLDLVVYNSGVAGPAMRLDDISDEEWDEALNVNLNGFFRVCRGSLPLLRKARAGGRIVAISSITARRPLLHRVSYAATKSALTGFVRSFALELGPDNITVNTISPGYVDGDRLQRVIQDQARAHEVTADTMHDRFTDHSPLGHFVRPQSIARAVLFLADDTAGDITGTDLNVSAGVWMD